MHENLISYINSHLEEDLDQESVVKVRQAFRLKRIRKHQFFLQEGEVCKKAGFIIKGAMKQYTVDESGKESIIGLFIENWWVGDRESMSMNTPSPYFIDALEPTEVLMVSKEEIDKNLSQLPFMKELSRVLTERQAYHLMRRVHAANTFSAEKRLKDLESSYPVFFQRFPQHIIASYLGMTKETLSRIRSSSKRNKL